MSKQCVRACMAIAVASASIHTFIAEHRIIPALFWGLMLADHASASPSVYPAI
jgi:hypothetical protein